MVRLVFWALAAIGAPVMAWSAVPLGQSQAKTVQLSDARVQLTEKLDEVREMREQAAGVTTRMAALAGSGKVKLNDETVDLMRSMVQEMQELNERMKRVEGEVQQIKSWIDGQDKSNADQEKDIKNLQWVRDSGFIQFQFRDSDESGREQSSFAQRRVRFGQIVQVDPKTQLRMSFDIASGTTATQTEMRDAFFQHTAVSTPDGWRLDVTGGQFTAPLGFEMARSDPDREFPERAQYNRALFDGDRIRGVFLRGSMPGGLSGILGVADSLAFNDPEQRDLAPGPSGRLAWLGGVRFSKDGLNAGVTGLAGSRPSFLGKGQPTVETSPEVERQFVYLDAAYRGLLVLNLTMRSEAMFGRDRVPNAVSAPSRSGAAVKGHQFQLDWAFDPRNVLSVRYEQFDPSGVLDGDVFSGYGLSYQHFLNQSVRLSLGIERFSNPARPRDFTVYTLRTQFRF